MIFLSINVVWCFLVHSSTNDFVYKIKTQITNAGSSSGLGLVLRLVLEIFVSEAIDMEAEGCSSCDVRIIGSSSSTHLQEVICEPMFLSETCLITSKHIYTIYKQNRYLTFSYALTLFSDFIFVHILLCHHNNLGPKTQCYTHYHWQSCSFLN